MKIEIPLESITKIAAKIAEAAKSILRNEVRVLEDSALATSTTQYCAFGEISIFRYLGQTELHRFTDLKGKPYVEVPIQHLREVFVPAGAELDTVVAELERRNVLQTFKKDDGSTTIKYTGPFDWA
jgi:hypothetical protein